MEKAKAFFLVCAGILFLTIALDFATSRANAVEESPAGLAYQFQVQDNTNIYLMTDEGKFWVWNGHTWIYVTNWPGGGVPVENTDWSQLKGSYGK
jgi:hypothetical protein